MIRLDNLINKQVTIYCINMEDETGLLSSFDVNGVMLEKKENSMFFPWQELTCIEEKSPYAEIQKTATKKKEIEIICSDDHLAKEKFSKVEAMLPDGYEVEWTEEYTDFAITDDDSNETIVVDLDVEEITVFYDKDFELAKKIATTIEIYKVRKDYQDE